ncbi:BaiN/RdsA family NAD(P)/FAD-dependent oxidoreductase [Marinilabilia sp.]
MKVAIIGGGAAGFFAAIAAKENHPNAGVVIFEKTGRVLSKVKISGGGRCNVTNACEQVSDLVMAYPRGGNSLKRLFHEFDNKDAMRWFESRGVPLVVQDDQCVFPVAQDSQMIINCFVSEAKKLGVRVETHSGVKSLEQEGDSWKLFFLNEDRPTEQFDKVIVTTGGSPKEKGLTWLKELGHKIIEPVPSLFSFNLSENKITRLTGLVVEDVWTSISGTKYKSEGALLITHWGMSGPAILKLSSFAARHLNDFNYQCNLQINWLAEKDLQWVVSRLKEIAENHPKKMMANYRPFSLPERLWIFLLEKIGLPGDKKWGETGKKIINKLVEVLTNDTYPVVGKATHKEEFVTCGGVSLKSVDMKTMQSKVAKNLYFAGEVLDIDAITGGFNLQAAWTTGFVAGQLK